MYEQREAKYQWGQRVVATTDLVNDGSYPDKPMDALLVAAGDTGEIVQIGHHTEANMPVYIVEFAGRGVIGCLEEEIVPAALAGERLPSPVAADA
jgi:nitrogen fixation protein NifZ